MQVEANMRSIRHEDALSAACKALCFELLELLEEGRNVYNAAGADEVDLAGRIDEPGREDVEIVGDVANNDGVARIVTACGATAEVCTSCEDIDELAFALVPPLGSKDERHRHDVED